MAGSAEPPSTAVRQAKGHTTVSAAGSSDVDALLGAWNLGDRGALGKLIPLVYAQLHRVARRQMAKQNSDHTLQNSALVNEVYLRLAKLGPVNWHDRAHFMSVCAQAMRQILTDHARSRLSLKRGAGVRQVPLDEVEIASRNRDIEILELDRTLDLLAKTDVRKSRVVELRFFGGLSVKETAAVLNVSEDTVNRDWKFAKHWLLSELGPGHHNGT